MKPSKERDTSTIDVDLSKIKFVFCDIDGVLTDGTKTFTNDGQVFSKPFSDADTMAMSLLRNSRERALIKNIIVPELVLVSGDNRVNEAFAKAHQVPFYHTHTNSKIDLCHDIVKGKFEPCEVLYLGNDINDLECLKSYVSACPSDAFDYIKKLCYIVTDAPGGRGAFREVVDKILFSKGLTLDDYLCCLTPYKNYPVDKSLLDIRHEIYKRKTLHEHK